MQKKEVYLLIPRSLAQGIADYLMTRPYGEVAGAMQGLAALVPTGGQSTEKEEAGFPTAPRKPEAPNGEAVDTTK